MSETVVVRYNSHDTHTLRCAAVILAVEKEVSFELTMAAEGLPAIDGASKDAPIAGSYSICKHVSAGAAGLDQTDSEKWLEECATVLDRSGFRHMTSIMSGTPAVDADKSSLEASLAKIEAAIKATSGSKTLFASLSLADIVLWSALYPALGAKGVLPSADQAQFPGVIEWFSTVSEAKCCKEAVKLVGAKKPSALLPPIPPKDASKEK